MGREDYLEAIKFVKTTLNDSTQLYGDKCLAYTIVNNKNTLNYLKILHYALFQLYPTNYDYKFELEMNSKDNEGSYRMSDRPYVTIRDIDEYVFVIINKWSINNSEFYNSIYKNMIMNELYDTPFNSKILDIRNSIRELGNDYVELVSKFSKDIINMFASDGYHRVNNIRDYLFALDVINTAVIETRDDLICRMDDGIYNDKFLNRSSIMDTINNNREILKNILNESFKEELVMYSKGLDELTIEIANVPEP